MHLADKFKSKDEPSDYPTHDEIADELGAKQVHYDIVDTTRWGHIVEYVYEAQGDDDLWEFARVEYEEASGDGETYYQPTWTAVRPVTKTVITYKVLD